MVPLRPAAQVPLTPFYGGPALFEMSDFKTLSALDKDEVESLRSLLSSTSISDASSDAVRLPAQVAYDALAWDTAKPESRPPMATRWLRHTLYLKNMLGPAQDYSVDDLLQLANDTRKGWTEGLPFLDVLPLSWQATDWLVGAWGALHDEGVSADGTAFRNAMSWGIELQHVQLDELKVIQDAIGAEKERVVLMDVLKALKQAAAMEDRIADSQPYLERLQVRHCPIAAVSNTAMRCMWFEAAVHYPQWKQCGPVVHAMRRAACGVLCALSALPSVHRAPYACSRCVGQAAGIRDA
jgi:hypothetical protein